MSNALQAWAMKQRTGSPSRKAVLMALADHANGHTGQCNPHVETLAYELELSFRTVQRSLEGLEQDGYIIRTRTKRPDGSWKAYEYSFPPDTVSGSPPDIDDASHRTLTTNPPDTVSGQCEPEVEPEVEPERARGEVEVWNAQSLVGWFVDESRDQSGQVVTKQTRGMVAKQVGAMLDEGVDPMIVGRCLRLLIERRLHPNTLPTLVLEAAAGPARRDSSRYGRGMTTAQILEATRGLK